MDGNDPSINLKGRRSFLVNLKMIAFHPTTIVYL